ncbi:MAG: ATP-binding cassette domain-containing protein [Lachnospiraceae bacterium]|nr:ATP-binding cassette domain-containing protein [Lachnospiraceae bacterium]
MDKNSISKATWRIMEQLLEVDDLSEALSGSLEVISEELDSAAGAIWLLDESGERLVPMFHFGPTDISGVTVENGVGIEGVVTKTGKSIVIEDTAKDARYEGCVFDEGGFVTKTMLCVPLNNLKDVIGCVQLVNKKGKGRYSEEDLVLAERMASLAAITIDEKGLIVGEEESKKVIISLRDVIKEFPSGDGVSRVLKGINLDIYENELVVILGESGCGKSTMMNIIGGMDYLTEGSLVIEGKDYSHPSDDDLTRFRRNYLGFVFQSYNLMPNLTALENVRFIAELVNDPMDPAEALSKVGLSSRANNYPAQMSGGQQQRVSIARAIVKRPKVILADEPTAALDYTTGLEVLKVVEEIVRNHGTTVIMVTHNVEIAKMADRVVKLRSGRVASIKKNLHPLNAEDLVW